MSWACHNYHPATKNPPREEGGKLSRNESVLWRKCFSVLGVRELQNRIKNRPENAVKLANKNMEKRNEIFRRRGYLSFLFCLSFYILRHGFIVAGWQLLNKQLLLLPKASPLASPMERSALRFSRFLTDHFSSGFEGRFKRKTAQSSFGIWCNSVSELRAVQSFVECFSRTTPSACPCRHRCTGAWSSILSPPSRCRKWYTEDSLRSRCPHFRQ